MVFKKKILLRSCTKLGQQKPCGTSYTMYNLKQESCFNSCLMKQQLKYLWRRFVIEQWIISSTWPTRVHYSATMDKYSSILMYYSHNNARAEAIASSEHTPRTRRFGKTTENLKCLSEVSCKKINALIQDGVYSKADFKSVQSGWFIDLSQFLIRKGIS